jgi:hypothetical protein
MARLPDRFDLWVRKARKCRDPARQADYVLGALAGLKEWYFPAVGRKENPLPAEAEIEGARYVLVFSDPGRIEEIHEDGTQRGDPLAAIAMPMAAAMAWCVERRAGVLVNPGEDSALIPVERLEIFQAEWRQRGGRQAAGFWIPNMTTEEEDFWQEQGL